MKWVSMKTEKPPEKTDVLVWDKHRHQQGLQPIQLIYPFRFDFSDDRYSHWMSLPKAPYPSWEERE